MKTLLTVLRGCIPPAWRRALLELEVAWTPHTGSRAVHHRLINPETRESVSSFPEALFEATTALHVVFSEYEQGWKRATLDLNLDAQSLSPSYEAKYTYGP